MIAYFTGDDDLSGDLYHLLVLGTPDDHMDNKFMKDNLTFVEDLDWKVVIDFDKESRICDFLHSEENSVMKIIASADEFDEKSIENQRNPDRLKNLHDDIKNSNQPSWVFIDGYGKLDPETTTMDALKWKRERKPGFKELLRFYSNQIPKQRAVIVFLLLSKNNDVLLEAADELISEFQGQFVCLAENDNIAETWKAELIKRNTADKETLDGLTVTGLPWAHVQTIITELTGSDREFSVTLQLPSALGTSTALPEKVKKDMSDLEIVGSNICSVDPDDEGNGNSGLLQESNSRSDSSKQQKLQHRARIEEDKFYRGGQVTWWNFKFNNHVLKREKHDELLNHIRSAVSVQSGRSYDENVKCVSLYHQPGAGGTTTARHVIWDLRKKFRCAIVKNVTNQTCSQILRFRAYGEAAQVKPKPVIIMLDNLDDDKITQLFAEVGEKAKHLNRDTGDDPFAIICVFLNVLRRSKPPSQYHQRSSERIILKQELTQEEQLWFKEKYKKLEEQFTHNLGEDPKMMISFNIFKEGFDSTYISNTVDKTISSMSMEKEKKLLRYLSLLNTYDLSITPVPISAFDVLMDDTCFAPVPKQPKAKSSQRQRQHSKESPRKKGVSRQWENRLSNEIKILLNVGSRQSMGDIKTLSIIHPLLSKEVLRVLSINGGKKQMLSEVAMELFEEPFLRFNWSIANEYLFKILKNILQHRNRLPDGRPESRFAPFIQEILECESQERAGKVLVKGFELKPNAFVAQQVARLFIFSQNWHRAKEYAEKATSMSENNSYFWDTRGQIYRSQIKELYKEFSSKSSVQYEEGIKAIQYTEKAIEFFQRSTEVAEGEKHSTQPNHAGFFGQVQVIVLLLDCFNYLPCFKDDTNLLHRFLVDPAYVPKEIEHWKNIGGVDYIEKIKGLNQKIVEVVTRIEDEAIQLRQDYWSDFTRNQMQFQSELLIKLKESIDNYYGEDSDEVPEGLSVEDANMFRGRRIRRMGGRSILRIFELRRTNDTAEQLLKIQSLARANMEFMDSGKINAEDLQTIISVNLALAVADPDYIHEIDYIEMVRWSRKLFELRNTLRIPVLEPFLFYVMFNWPRENTKEHVNPKQIKDAIKQWRAAYNKKYPRQALQAEEGKPYKKKDTTIFFLANGSNMAAISDCEDLKRKMGIDISGEKFWEDPHILCTLQRFTGVLRPDGMLVIVDLVYGGGYHEKLEIPTSFPIRERAWWNKKVFFVIGFSWQGPKAFDVKQDDPTLDYNPPEGHRSTKPKEQATGGRPSKQLHETNLLTERNYQQRKHELDSKLTAIRNLRETLKREKRRPNKKEVVILSIYVRIYKSSGC